MNPKIEEFTDVCQANIDGFLPTGQNKKHVYSFFLPFFPKHAQNSFCYGKNNPELLTSARFLSSRFDFMLR